MIAEAATHLSGQGEGLYPHFQNTQEARSIPAQPLLELRQERESDIVMACQPAKQVELE
jgi:hypothetical protein